MKKLLAITLISLATAPIANAQASAPQEIRKHARETAISISQLLSPKAHSSTYRVRCRGIGGGDWRCKLRLRGVVAKCYIEIDYDSRPKVWIVYAPVFLCG
jgi:hypothetical protein